MNHDTYAKVLVEKSQAWLLTSEEIKAFLEANNYSKLENVIARREEAIQGYMDCLERWNVYLKSQDGFDDEEIFLPRLLDYFERQGLKVLVQALNEVKQNLGKIRALDTDITNLAKQIPADIKQLLVDLQIKKPALSAYLKSKTDPLTSFSRFDRSK